MNNTIEIILIVAIIVVQLYVFWDTWKKIGLFRVTIPAVGQFYTVKVRVPDEQLSDITAKQIFGDLEQYQILADDMGARRAKGQVDLVLLNTHVAQNPLLETILNAINTYLLRNKGAVSDFNLIKDVVERNTDSLDEQINTQLPIPLYLGLMGTMIGVIFGLLFMPELSTNIDPITGKLLNVITDLDELKAARAAIDTNFNIAVSGLISSVSYAMIASLFGLLFTTINSGLFYKGAKAKVEKLKNDFYTMIQTEMLPVLSKDATSAIIALQQNLNHFNKDFSENMGGFNSVLDRILSSFDGQVEMMAQLKEIDVAKIARLNVDVMKELRQSAKEFEKFNTYLAQVNDFVDNAKQLNFNIGSQLERTQNIENIASAIQENVALNKQLIDVLQSDLHQLDVRKEHMVQAVVAIDDVLKKSLDDLARMTETRITQIKGVVIKEEDFIGKLISKDAANFDELKNLGKMRESVEQMRDEDKIQTEHVKALMVSQDAKIDTVVSEISGLLKTFDKRDKEKSRTTTSVQVALYVCAACVVLFFAYMLYERQTESTQKQAVEDRLIEYFKERDAAEKR